MSIQQFLLILRARWLVVLGVLVGMVVLALLVSLVMPKKYSASAAVVVDIKPDPVAGMFLPVQMMPGYMATQIDVINSERVARRVVKTLKLDQVPQFREQWLEATDGRGALDSWLGNMLAKQLDVKPSRESNVIDISFTWPDPKAAAALANAFAQAYIDTTLELKVEPAKQYAAWFEDRNHAVREDLERAQKKLSDYQREHGIVASDERLDVETARLSELSSQLVGIQSLRSDSQSRQRQAATGRDAIPEVLNNPVVAGISADIVRLEARREETASKLGPAHPDIRHADAELSALRERRSQEVAKVTGSLGANNQVNVQREADTRGAVERQKQRILELKRQRDEVTVLQNDVALAQRNHELVTQRLAQSSLESQIQQTNIVMLTPASEPLDPSSPRLFLNLLLAVFLGTLCGVGTAILLELLDQRIRGADDMEALMTAPVLGVLRDARTKAASSRGWLRRNVGPRTPAAAGA